MIIIIIIIREVLTERLRGVRETASLLHNRMMENMGYGQQERLKGIVEKEAEEEQAVVVKEEDEEAKEQWQGPPVIQEQQQDDDEQYNTVAKIK